MKKINYYVTIAIVILLNSTNLFAQFDPIDWKNLGGDIVTNPKDKIDINPFPVLFVPAIECETNYTWKPTENYIPVWMKDNQNIVDEDVSPLYVRRDLYTCEKVIRPLVKSETANGRIYYEGNTDPNGNSNSGCAEDFTKCNIGFVGVNNTSPTEQLDVIGNIKSSHNFIGKAAEISSIVYDGTIRDARGNATGKTSAFKFQTQEVAFSGNIIANGISTSNLITNGNLDITGRISIGDGISLKKPISTFSNYSLSVDGNIVCRRLQAQQTSWADKVFNSDYKLMSLKEIESFIKLNKHLPEIPSEEEVIENGINVGEMNKLLLQKVEELTLHLIEMNKKIQNLEQKISK